jgi:hypothetical protein
MISMELIAYCLVCGGIYLAVATVVLAMIGRWLNITKGVPGELLEEVNLGWYLANYVMEMLFFVAVPTLAYSFFAVILPLTGIRIGLAVALGAIILGAAPAIVGLAVRLRLPMPFLLYFLLGLTIKLAGALAIIGFLYSL